jgi:thiol-disulfide isomerase/thioredoxin
MKAYHKRQTVLRFFFLAALLICIFGMAYSVNCSAQAGQEEQSSKPCEQPGADACEGTPFAFSDEAGKKIPTAGTTYNVIGASAASNPVIYFFKGDGCPKCAEEERFLEALSKKIPKVEIRAYEVWRHAGNAAMMQNLLKSRGVDATGIPFTIVGNRIFYGFSPQIAEEIEIAIASCTPSSCPDPASEGAPQKLISTGGGSVEIPLVGKVDLSGYSLPFVTVVIASLDSFNPCAFFVLLSLLGILTYARSRKKMLLVGGVFLLFSGSIYFLFMAAWLNLFLVIEKVGFITSIAGIVSIMIGAVNIKDFFAFKRGVSLSIPDSAKPKLFDRMRRLVRSTSMLSVLAGTAVLAVAANSYELLCTAGFPMVYTRILTLNNLSPASYYLYLGLYNLIYVIPMAVIVWAFAFTAGKRKLTEWQGRVLKLISGAMMFALGVVLLANPSLMNNIVAATAILVGTVGASLLLAWVAGKVEKAKASPPRARFD